MRYTIKLLSLLFALTCSRQALAQDQIFVGSTPCSEVTRPVPGIPDDRGCELIKWELRLSGGPEAGNYLLFCSYGLPKQGTRGFINGGYQLRREGKWGLRKDIYRLDPDKPLESIAFRRLNENLIHLLDDRQQLMIGNGAWSYTLSKLPK